MRGDARRWSHRRGHPALQWLDVGGLSQAWEVAHWNVAALGAAVAALLATRGTTGLVRRVIGTA